MRVTYGISPRQTRSAIVPTTVLLGPYRAIAMRDSLPRATLRGLRRFALPWANLFCPIGQRCEAFLYRNNWGFLIREYVKKSQIPTDN